VWPLSDFSYSPVSKSHTFRVASSLADTITLKTGWNITCKRKYRAINYIHYLEILRGKTKGVHPYELIMSSQQICTLYTQMILQIRMKQATMMIPRTSSSVCLHSFWLTSQTCASVSL
jgi:hypothetical protein